MFGQRIAQKIWLGYAIPLAVLVVVGVLVPAALAAILSRTTGEFERSSRLVEQIGAMEQAVLSSETSLRSYLFSGDREDRRAFRRSNSEYLTLHWDVARTAREYDALYSPLIEADSNYRRWLRTTAEPQLADGGGGGGDGAQNVGREDLSRVRTALVRLKASASGLRDVQAERARTAERVRRGLLIAGPAVALLLALLIGRSISLGVTQPLLALTEAARALERGQPTALLLPPGTGDGDDVDDELGDLKRSFARMARATGQREAVLRARTETLGALNRRIEAVLNATNDGIILLDRGGGFSIVNQRLADLFGLEPDDLLDHTYDQAEPLLLARFRDKELLRDEMHRLLADGDAVVDQTFEVVEPRRCMLRIYSAPVRGEDGAERLGRIFVFRDVTREFAVDRMKTEFISVVSHELRTPLTAIKGYVDLILADQTGPINELQREFLGIVQSCTTRLSTLIGDMLDISRIESGRVEVRREAVDYARVLRETVASLAREAEAEGIALSLEIPPDLAPIRGDADRVAQVLVNLIGNGIKYTPRGGRVRVTVEAETPSFVTTEIADTGVGIAPEDQERLFQKFFRADNSLTREVGGTGLGLAITKALVEKLNGGIWLTSEPGRGSSFFFTLPVATEAAKEPPDNSPPSA